MSFIFVRILWITLLWRNGFGKSRINQGSQVSIEDAPYMARVRIKLNATVGFACDGSILNDLYILTAGHCVTDESNINVPNPPTYGPSNFSILIGTTDLDEPDRGEAIDVSKVFFREFSLKNDIALLKLSSRIMLNGITKMAVTLPINTNYYPKNRTNAYVDGWGTNPQNTDKLLRANIYTISVEECNAGTASDADRDRTYQICTLGENGAGPCIKDSGGPMLRLDDGVQIGIVSLVPQNCAHPGGTISTFTGVAPNLNWIRRVINENDGNVECVAPTVPAKDKPNRRPANIIRLPLDG